MECDEEQPLVSFGEFHMLHHNDYQGNKNDKFSVLVSGSMRDYGVLTH